MGHFYNDDEYLELYNIFKKFLKFEGSFQKFYKENNVTSSKVSFAKRSFLFLDNPKLFEDRKAIVSTIHQKKLSKTEAAKYFNITNSQISEAIYSVNGYIKIKKIHLERNLPFPEEITNMDFIPIKKTRIKRKHTLAIDEKQESVPQHEVLPKKNDVEIMIQKGVRVFISEDLGTEKLVKIIEFLKDL